MNSLVEQNQISDCELLAIKKLLRERGKKNE